MELLKFLSFVALVTYNSAVPSPDTNIQIQHYDGPVYLGTTTTNCCPFCNSILKPPTGTEVTCDTTPEILYPQSKTAFYGNSNGAENEPIEITISVDSKEPNEVLDDKKVFGKASGKPKDLLKSLMHNDATKTGNPNFPVISKNTGTGKNTRFPFGPNIFGASSPSVNPTECKPLSSFLPNTTPNSYKVPILTQGPQSNSEEPVLVPQKFMYSLILDGDVASNQNGYDCKCFYY